MNRYLLYVHQMDSKLSGSRVVKAHMVECRLILLVNTLDQHLKRYSMDILIDSLSTLN